jgi:hypothetical protein
MRKMGIWRGMENMEMKGMEIGKIGVGTEEVPQAALNKCCQEWIKKMETREIGVWTEKVPPAALKKRRQEQTRNPFLGGGEEVEEAEKGGEERAWMEE